MILKYDELIEDNIIKIGSLILLQPTNKESKWFSIEVDVPNYQKLSKESRMSTELIGKKVGDTINFGKGFKILEVKKYQNPNTHKSIPVGKTVWIFQANPEKYKILEALKDPSVGSIIHWNVKQYANEIHIGDIALMWLSGKEAGVYFIAEIVTMPTMLLEPVSESIYWVDKSEKIEKKLSVKLNILEDLSENPVLRTNLKKIEKTENLSIIKQPRGTNFKVTNEEWEVLHDLIKHHKLNLS